MTTLADNFRSSGFFGIRTPLLPFRTLEEWVEGVGGNAVADREELCSRLRTIVARADVREALHVASPSTVAALDNWTEGRAKNSPRIERTLVRYLSRMASRCTPFGLFASCSVGRISDSTCLQVEDAKTWRRNLRLDNDYVFALTWHLANRPEIRDQLIYRPNSSLYRLAGRWRFVETEFRGVVRRDNLIALDGDEYLSIAIKQAANGVTRDELAECLVVADLEGEITPELAKSYVSDLIEQQVLVSELQPIITGREPLEDLIDQLHGLTGIESTKACLNEIKAKILAMNSMAIGVEASYYQSIAEIAKSLEVETGDIFQVDMFAAAPSATCGAAVVDELLRSVDALHRISGRPAQDAFTSFKEAFVRRYETRDVPLMEVLDEETGIGFDRLASANTDNAPLLRGLRFKGEQEGRAVAWSKRDAYLLDRVTQLHRGDDLQLTASDIDRLAETEPLPMPDAFSVTAVLGSATAEADSGMRVLLRAVSGAPGVAIFGRFCHGDSALLDYVSQHLRAEEAIRPSAVFAEVVHLPEGRMGNILCRPVLRDYEIPYLGRSGASREQQILVSDLLVGIRNDRVSLMSKRLGVEVIPRMTNAHNFSGGHVVYRFLCAMQRQGVVPWLVWAWGPLEAVAYLPRVRFNRTILSRARWRVDRFEIETLTRGSTSDQLRAFQDWSVAQKLPRWVALVDGDNELLTDCTNLLSLETLLGALRGRSSAVMVEMYPSPEELRMESPDGKLTHEIVVPFVRRTIPAGDTSKQVPKAPTKMVRSLAPGSECLYLKWYAGTATIDRLILDIVPVLTELHATNAPPGSWFFIRYSDPESHLRLRFHGSPDWLFRGLLPVACDVLRPALDDGRVWRHQLDTYEREIERYGGDLGIAVSEEVFWRDSEAAAGILSLLQGEGGLDARWRICLAAWDMWMDDLGFSLQGKHDLMLTRRSGFEQQFAGKKMAHTLGDRFRAMRKSIEGLLTTSIPADDESMTAALDLLRRRSQKLNGTIQRLRSGVQRGELGVPFGGFASIHMHMQANRLLRSSQTHQEFVLCDFLLRMYQSRLGQEKGRGRKVQN